MKKLKPFLKIQIFVKLNLNLFNVFLIKLLQNSKFFKGFLKII